MTENMDLTQQNTPDIPVIESSVETPIAILMAVGDSHLDSDNYGYHLDYPKEALYYEELFNHIAETEHVTHYVHAGDFVMHKDFSLAYRAKVDAILTARKQLIESRGGEVIHIRGNHDISGKSVTEYDYYAQRGLFVPAAEKPELLIKNSQGQTVLHAAFRDYKDTAGFIPTGITNIMFAHGHFAFDRVLEGNDMPNYGQAIKISNKRDWEGIDYLICGHIHTEHVMRGQICGHSCTVHYLPCMSRPAYLKRFEEGPEAVREGCIDLIKVYEDRVEIERVPIPFLDNKVCFNMERIMNDAAKLEMSMVNKDRQEALKSMAEELQQYEKRETDPVQQIMTLPNTQDKHKEIVIDWLAEAQEALKRGQTPASMAK